MKLAKHFTLYFAKPLRASFTLACIAVTPVSAEEIVADASVKPKIEKLDENRYRIGDITLDKHTREIRFPALVNMREGFLEFLIVHEHGAVHKSLFRTHVSPLHINVALTLLSYKPSKELFRIPLEPGIPSKPYDNQFPDSNFMKTKSYLAIALYFAVFPVNAQSNNVHISIKQEIEQSIARGNTWLVEQQKEKGFWDDGGLPAFTALALTAIVRDPNVDLSDGKLPDHVKKGFDWLLEQQKEDGGIYNRGLAVYNTATSLTAMSSVGLKEFEPAIVKARRHLIANQWDIGVKGETDDKNDGGIGYGSKDDHTDMSNTYLALEALALSDTVIEDGNYANEPKLDWDAALTFLSRSQNLTATNDQEWASDDPNNKGGFIYTPGDSKAGTETTADGNVALRSYGSISYAGLLSLIYAKLTPDDPRVIAVKSWLGRNYTVEENPNMGPQGLFYYYQAMAKALNAAGIDKLKLEDGSVADWRKDLAGKLLSTQRENGSWVNENGRWMESNPVLVTAYTVMALEEIHRSFP